MFNSSFIMPAAFQAEGVVNLFIQCIQLFVNGVVFSNWFISHLFYPAHCGLRLGEIFMTARNNRRRDCRAEAQLCAERDTFISLPVTSA